MASRAVRTGPSDRPAVLTEQRRTEIMRGSVRGLVYEGHNFNHCVEVSTTGALGKVYLSRQNLVELRRLIDVAEEAFDRLDERGGTPFLRPPQKLVL